MGTRTDKRKNIVSTNGNNKTEIYMNGVRLEDANRCANTLSRDGIFINIGITIATAASAMSRLYRV